MKRRAFLGMGAAGFATAAAGTWLWPEQGWLNPCRAGLPAAAVQHELVRAAWDGLDPARVWDAHVHLTGIGDAGSGVWINPHMRSVLHPMQYAQRLFFLNAACADAAAPGQVDAAYVDRLASLAAAFPAGVKVVLLAFDHAYDAQARRQLGRSAFHTPDRYAQAIASVHPDRFEWAASIHPYREDCVEALEWAAGHGARAVKWLPPAMGIDPGSPRCDRFYAAAARLRIALLTHAGEEKAVHGAGEHAFGNPLRLRRALDHGVRVVVAHCASVGHDVDLDRGANGPPTASFELFARLMDDARYSARLYGDVSAIAQINRPTANLRHLLEREEWHARLLNGSDYPLPGVLPLISIRRLIAADLLDAEAAAVLQAIRAHNPLLFDLVLKRLLRAGKRRFAPAVFNTRDFFLGAGPAPPAAPDPGGLSSPHATR
jgi:mannonate dehydratase